MLPEGLLNPIGVTMPVNVLGSTAVAPANGSVPAEVDAVVVVGGGGGVVDDAGPVDDVLAVVRLVPSSEPELTGIGGTGVPLDPRSVVLPAVSVVVPSDPVPEDGLALVVAEVPAGDVPATALPPTVEEQPTSNSAVPRPMRGSRRWIFVMSINPTRWPRTRWCRDVR
jgi:hypothetical protein